LFTLVLQQGFLPLVRFLWIHLGGSTIAISNELIGTLAGFFAILTLVVIWSLISAWMDMRFLLGDLDVSKFEHRAYECAKIKVGHQIPFDILLYLSLIVLAICGYYVTVSFKGLASQQFVHEFPYHVIVNAIFLGGLLCLGLIALARRLWL